MSYISPSEINSSKGIGHILEYINVVSQYWAGRMTMIAIFVLFFMGYLRSKGDDDFVSAFAVSSYITFVIGLLFWLIKFLDSVSFGIIVGITVISSAILFLDKRGS